MHARVLLSDRSTRRQIAEVIAQLKVKVDAHKGISTFLNYLTLYRIIFNFLALVSALKNVSYIGHITSSICRNILLTWPGDGH